MMTDRELELRPQQWALLLSAAGTSPPRKRARDQQADEAGRGLRRRLLERLIERDPSWEELVETLALIIEQTPGPAGPARAVARSLADELHDLRTNPRLTQWLLDQAVEG